MPPLHEGWRPAVDEVVPDDAVDAVDAERDERQAEPGADRVTPPHLHTREPVLWLLGDGLSGVAGMAMLRGGLLLVWLTHDIS